MNMLKRLALFCALIFPAAAFAATATGTLVQNGSGSLLTAGTITFGTKQLTVTAGAFSGNVDSGLVTVTVRNDQSQVILTVPGVQIASGSTVNWNTYRVPNGTSGVGAPYMSCGGGIYTELGVPQPNAAWLCNGSTGTYTQQNPPGAQPSGLYSGAGAPNFICTSPCQWTDSVGNTIYNNTAPAGQAQNSWVMVAGSGTVTTVGAPPFYSVASPTTAPTFSLLTQAANTVNAGPASGAAAAPSYRALVAGDLPSGTGTIGGGGASGNLTKFTAGSTIGNAIAGTDYPGLASTNTFSGANTITGKFTASSEYLNYLMAPCVDQYLNGGTDWGVALQAIDTNSAANFPNSWSVCNPGAVASLLIKTPVVWTHPINLYQTTGAFTNDPSLVSAYFPACVSGPATVTQGSNIMDCTASGGVNTAGGLKVGSVVGVNVGAGIPPDEYVVAITDGNHFTIPFNADLYTECQVVNATPNCSHPTRLAGFDPSAVSSTLPAGAFSGTVVGSPVFVPSTGLTATAVASGNTVVSITYTSPQAIVLGTNATASSLCPDGNPCNMTLGAVSGSTWEVPLTAGNAVFLLTIEPSHTNGMQTPGGPYSGGGLWGVRFVGNRSPNVYGVQIQGYDAYVLTHSTIRGFSGPGLTLGGYPISGITAPVSMRETTVDASIISDNATIVTNQSGIQVITPPGTSTNQDDDNTLWFATDEFDCEQGVTMSLATYNRTNQGANPPKGPDNIYFSGGTQLEGCYNLEYPNYGPGSQSGATNFEFAKPLIYMHDARDVHGSAILDGTGIASVDVENVSAGNVDLVASKADVGGNLGTSQTYTVNWPAGTQFTFVSGSGGGFVSNPDSATDGGPWDDILMDVKSADAGACSSTNGVAFRTQIQNAFPNSTTGNAQADPGCHTAPITISTLTGGFLYNQPHAGLTSTGSGLTPVNYSSILGLASLQGANTKAALGITGSMAQAWEGYLPTAGEHTFAPPTISEDGLYVYPPRSYVNGGTGSGIKGTDAQISIWNASGAMVPKTISGCTITDTGVMTCPQTATGYCTGVATSSSTLKLFGLGSTTATCTSAGNVSEGIQPTASGTVSNLSVRCNTTGVSSSSGVFTLLDQPVNSGTPAATSLTVTYGTTTAAHIVTASGTYAYNANDILQVQFTTQASETLGGCTVSFNY